MEEIKLGDTTFFVDRLSAMAGWRLLMDIANELSKKELSVLEEILKDDNISLSDADVGVKLITKGAPVLLGLDADFVENVQGRLFEKVKFKNSVSIDAQKLKGAEDMAFSDLGALHVPQLLFKALTVNFLESFGDLLSLLSQKEVEGQDSQA